MKQKGLLLAALLLTLFCHADTLELRSATPLEKGIFLKNHLWVFEDVSGTQTPSTVLAQPGLSVPLAALQPQKPTSTYWLTLPVRNTSVLPAIETALSFTNLTFVEVYLYQDNQLLLHKKAGAFQPATHIHAGDSRFHIVLPLPSGSDYTLLLKVNHTKHYQPQFDFTLQTKEVYIDKKHRQALLDLWLQGAVCIFFLYTLLSWMVSRFRPYLWLLFYIGGVGLYSISMGGYFIDWFFPHAPETGWLFNIHFLHLGLLGVYLLILDFWQLKEKSRLLYRWGQVVIAGVVVVSITSFGINYFTSNYYLMNNINLLSYVVPFSFMSYALWSCWKSLNRAQRFLAYGIILFALAGLTTTLGSAFLHEQSILLTPYISHTATLGVVVLFATGLKEELRLYELEKNAALQQFNQLQQEQNSLLEEKVEERTQALLLSNQELTQQQALLAERNQKIETLINELNHRVKNNLQLLYSLIHLQLPGVQDAAAREILKGHIAKIKAMMLVNEQLYRFEDQSAHCIRAFTQDLALYVQKIYDPAQQVRPSLQIPENIMLDGKNILSYGLILSELLTNSFKYAFQDHPTPEIHIHFDRPGASHLQFTYRDNGKGLSPQQTSYNSMGLLLIQDLTRQMKGTVEVQSHNGLTYKFVFPL